MNAIVGYIEARDVPTLVWEDEDEKGARTHRLYAEPVDAATDLFHWPPLAVPRLHREAVALPAAPFEKGMAGYMADPGERYLGDPDTEWLIEYTFGPDGLTLHRAIHGGDGEAVTADELALHYAHYPNAWTDMAEVCLDQYQTYRELGEVP